MEGGISWESTTNESKARQIADHATALMTETYASEFPEGYAIRWQRRWKFSTRLLAFRHDQRQRWEGLCEKLAMTGAWQKPLMLIPKASMALERSVVICFFLFQYRLRDLPGILRRKIGYFLESIKQG